MAKKVRKKILIKSEKMGRIMTWFYDNIFLYGDPWEKWWKERGRDDFLEWVKDRNIDYIKEI